MGMMSEIVCPKCGYQAKVIGVGGQVGEMGIVITTYVCLATKELVDLSDGKICQYCNKKDNHKEWDDKTLLCPKCDALMDETYTGFWD